MSQRLFRSLSRSRGNLAASSLWCLLPALVLAVMSLMPVRAWGNAPVVRLLTLSPTSVQSGQSVTLTVYLTGSAPSSGESVGIYRQSGASWLFLGNLNVSPGYIGVSCPLTVPSVTTTTAVTYGAVCNGGAYTASLTVYPTSGGGGNVNYNTVLQQGNGQSKHWVWDYQQGYYSYTLTFYSNGNGVYSGYQYAGGQWIPSPSNSFTWTISGNVLNLSTFLGSGFPSQFTLGQYNPNNGTLSVNYTLPYLGNQQSTWYLTSVTIDY